MWWLHSRARNYAVAAAAMVLQLRPREMVIKILLLVSEFQFTMGKRTCKTLCTPLHSCKSRELRGGVLFTDCFCLRRNGLQYDCRRSGCQSNPLCQGLLAPLCEPSRIACHTHNTNPHAESLSAVCRMRRC